jgi:hypothetical protein
MINGPQSILNRDAPPPATSGNPPASAAGTTCATTGNAAPTSNAARATAVRLKIIQCLLHCAGNTRAILIHGRFRRDSPFNSLSAGLFDTVQASRKQPS